ncbi:type II secretion system protein [Pseudomonas sp.]|jgi:prepilin-type N-terminal cleavage/methylation domain-containing protein|uniref:pilus assembly FimT family protein n=1 Tax=Pseudomonas sp. TaxID=306 RepID=UPI002579DA36|nr:type II secretion system protein [Pseudomonas sp.]
MVKTRGFTLVELMVTVTVMSVILLAAVPLTMGWSSSARQLETANLLKQGVSRAKATALRNPGGVGLESPAAALCLSNDTLSLVRQDKAGTFSCSPSNSSYSIWSAKVPEGVAVQVGGADFQCLAMDNRGLAVNQSGCATTAANSITVSTGGQDAIEVPII